MSQLSERYGTALMSLQAGRPPDLQRGVGIAHLEVPLPAPVKVEFERWQRGERDPVLPDEAAGLLWSSPVAEFLDGREDAWLEVPGVSMLLPRLTALLALVPDSQPQDRAALLTFVAKSIEMPEDDLKIRLERAHFEHLLGDLVLLFKYAATGTRRPIGLAADLFRLATILVMDDASWADGATVSGLMNATPRAAAVCCPGCQKGPFGAGFGNTAYSRRRTSNRLVHA